VNAGRRIEIRKAFYQEGILDAVHGPKWFTAPTSGKGARDVSD
jgi:hypothetical protein